MKKNDDLGTLELVEFNPETCVSEGRTHEPSISFSAKAGLVTLNKALCEMLGITNQDEPKVLFHQNKQDGGSWYIEVSPKGFTLRVKDGKCMLNNTKLVREIFKSLDYSDGSGKCLVSKTKLSSGEKTLYFIITSSLKNRK